MTTENPKANNVDPPLGSEAAEEEICHSQHHSRIASGEEESQDNHGRTVLADRHDPAYWLLIEQLQQGVLTLKADGTIVYCNRWMAELLKMPPEKLIGAALQDFVASEDRDLYDNLLWRGHRRSGRGAARLRRSDDGLVPTYLAFNVLPTGCGAPIGVLVTDLTVQKHHEQLTSAHQALSKSEGLLKESQERLQHALKAACAGVWDYDLDTPRARWSAEMFSLYGLDVNSSPPSLSDFADLIHSDDRDRAMSEIATAAERKGPFEIEFRIIRPDRSARWVMSSGVVRDKKAWGIDQDVTKRKHAEAKLSDSESLLRRTLDTAAVGLTRCSRDLRYLSANSAYARIAGLPVEQIIGKPVVEVMGQAAFESIYPYIKQVLLGKRVEFETEVPFATQGGRCLHAVYTPDEDSQGSIVGWVASVTDITERKRVETQLRESDHRLRLAMASAGTGMWDWDVSTDTVVWSAECLKIHGLSDGEFGGTATAFDRLVHPDDRARVWASVRAAVEQKTLYECEFRIVRPNGDLRWVTNMGRAIYDDRGQPLRMVGTITDITGRKLTEQSNAAQLKAMTRLCEVGNRCASPITDIEGCLKEFLDAAIELTYADRGTIQLRDSSAGSLQIRAHWGFDERFLGFFQSVHDRLGSTCGAAMAQARQVVAEDVTTSELFAHTPSLPVLLEAGVRAVQSTPLISSTGQVLGIISTHFSVPHRPGEQELRFMELLARQAADYLERKAGEEEVRRRAEEFQVLLDTLPVGVFVAHDPQARKITGNRAAQDLLRTPIPNLSLSAPPEEVPTNFRVCQNGVELPADQLPVQRAARGEAVVNEEFDIVFEDGSVATELISATPLYDADGRARGAVAGVLDITARKRAETEREQVMDTLNRLIASAPVGIALLDTEMRFKHINQPLADMNGLPVDAHLGKTVAEVVPDLYASVKPVFERVMSTGEVVSEFILEGETPKAAGVKRVWQEGWFPVSGADGRPSGVGVIIQEITEQRRLEQEREDNQRTLFTLVEQCPFGIYIVDDEFCIASVNSGSHDNAFANVRPLIGRPFDEAMQIIWPEPVASDIIQHFHHTLTTGEPYSSRDFVSRRADVDRNEAYEWELYRIAMPGGRLGVVCCYFDSTRLRQAEQALKDADRKKDEFLATLAHELRNPLAPLRNGLEIMKLAGGDSSAIEQSRSMMERQVDQMTRLIDDLLDVARISQGKINLKKSTMNLGDAIRNAVDTSRPLIDAQSHELALDVPSEPIFVEGDLSRLSQVFGNLLNNAAKYTNKGGHIRVAVERQAKDVVVSIADDGVGIPATMLNTVFDIFAQVDRSLEKSQGGLGIGLNIVKRLVEKHGGSVSAESGGKGKGSTFTVRLPGVWSVRSDASEDCNTKPMPDARQRIIVADDNRDSAMSLAMMLKLQGNETQLAFDGLEVVAVAQTFRPDVILMDIGMPKLNGYDACRRIRSEPWGKEIVIVACTGWGQEDDRRQSQAAGFDTHMVKPVDSAVLAKLLADIRLARVSDFGGPGGK